MVCGVGMCVHVCI